MRSYSMPSSGYPFYQYQQEALRALKIIDDPSAQTIDRVSADITPQELYDRYIALGIPVIIEKGLLDKWPALQNWKLLQLLQHHRQRNGNTEADRHSGSSNARGSASQKAYKAENVNGNPKEPQHPHSPQEQQDREGVVTFKVKRGLADGRPGLYGLVHTEPKTKPAAHMVGRGDAEWPWFEEPASTEYSDGVAADVELRQRWQRFMASMAKRHAAGWTFAAKECVMISSDGESRLMVAPPPRPGEALEEAAETASRESRGPIKEGGGKEAANAAQGSQGIQALSVMTVPEYVKAVMAPTHFGPENTTSAHMFNASHPDLRYVFNTMENSPLHNDFTVPDVFEALTSATGKYAGSFAGDGHGPGVFEFFFGPALSGAGMHAHPAAW